MSTFTNAELLKIARHQKSFLTTLMVLVGIMVAGIITLYAGMTDVFGILIMVYVFACIFQLLYTYKLVSSMKKSAIGTLLLILFFSIVFPLIALLIMFNQSSKASLILKGAGYKIGFLGADIKALTAACAPSAS